MGGPQDLEPTALLVGGPEILHVCMLLHTCKYCPWARRGQIRLEDYLVIGASPPYNHVE